MNIELSELKKHIKMLETMGEILREESETIGNLYDRYKKAYSNNDIFECIMLLLRICKCDGQHLKKGMLLSDSLLNPMGYKYTKEDYRKTMSILSYVYKLADDEVTEDCKKTIREFWLYTNVLYENNKLNSERLEESTFFKYPLSEQLRMLCIYIQDQSRLMKHKLSRNEKGYITGMESELALYNVDFYPEQKISLDDNYEGILEYVNTLISYLYYAKKDDFKLNNTKDHGDIHHFNIPEFSKIIVIAQQRTMYEQFEERFRYSQWKLLKNGIDDESLYYIEPSNERKNLAHHTAILRRGYKSYSNSIIKLSDIRENIGDKFGGLLEKINIDNLCDFHFDKTEYENASKLGCSIAEVGRSMIKPIYFKLSFNEVSIEDIINTYTYLYTFSNLYMAAVNESFKEDDYSSYKYTVPVVDIEYFVKEICYLLDVPENKAYKMISCFIYNPQKNNCEIFTQPLIMVNEKQVLLCETLISTYNIERAVEKLLQKNKVDYSSAGKEYENRVIDELKNCNGISVNTSKIEFVAYDGKNVEFDLIATLEDYLLIIELKSLTTPYENKELMSREKVIEEGVEQVNRRIEIVKHDWEKICTLADIDLPEKPYSESKIIKIVCTDIYDFTGLKYNGVTITDDTSLLKYFVTGEVYKAKLADGFPEKIEIIPLQKEGIPRAKEFKEYLYNPITLKNIASCMKTVFKPIPRLKNDKQMGIMELSLVDDPYDGENYNKPVRNVVKKVGRNEKCPCGSDKKFKNCCGK